MKKMTDQNESEYSRTWQGDMLFGILSTKNQSTRLKATPDALLLAGPLGKMFNLPADSIRAIEPGRWSIWFLSGLLSGCIRIHHNVDGVPKRLLFSASGVDCRKVAKQLSEMGYEVPQHPNRHVFSKAADGL